MAGPRKIRGFTGLQQAFDEVRFGAERTLNLRASLPTGAEASRRVDLWLRERQVQKADELLVITGRGNNSENGISVVREAAIRVFRELQRKGVVASFVEHTPGSFVVTVMPMAAMLEAAKRRREPEQQPPPASPPTLAALDDETHVLLRALAERSLDAIGVRERGPFLEGEMLRLFGILGASAGSGADRDRRFHDAIERAMAESD
ncbi:MAG: hypothetical protein ABI601_00025 [bacterium]